MVRRRLTAATRLEYAQKNKSTFGVHRKLILYGILFPLSLGLFLIPEVGTRKYDNDNEVKLRTPYDDSEYGTEDRDVFEDVRMSFVPEYRDRNQNYRKISPRSKRETYGIFLKPKGYTPAKYDTKVKERDPDYNPDYYETDNIPKSSNSVLHLEDEQFDRSLLQYHPTDTVRKHRNKRTADQELANLISGAIQQKINEQIAISVLATVLTLNDSLFAPNITRADLTKAAFKFSQGAFHPLDLKTIEKATETENLLKSIQHEEGVDLYVPSTYAHKFGKTTRLHHAAQTTAATSTPKYSTEGEYILVGNRAKVTTSPKRAKTTRKHERNVQIVTQPTRRAEDHRKDMSIKCKECAKYKPDPAKPIDVPMACRECEAYIARLEKLERKSKNRAVHTRTEDDEDGVIVEDYYDYDDDVIYKDVTKEQFRSVKKGRTDSNQSDATCGLDEIGVTTVIEVNADEDQCEKEFKATEPTTVTEEELDEDMEVVVKHEDTSSNTEDCNTTTEIDPCKTTTEIDSCKTTTELGVDCKTTSETGTAGKTTTELVTEESIDYDNKEDSTVTCKDVVEVQTITTLTDATEEVEPEEVFNQCQPGIGEDLTADRDDLPDCLDDVENDNVVSKAGKKQVTPVEQGYPIKKKIYYREETIKPDYNYVEQRDPYSPKSIYEERPARVYPVTKDRSVKKKNDNDDDCSDESVDKEPGTTACETADKFDTPLPEGKPLSSVCDPDTTTSNCMDLLTPEYNLLVDEKLSFPIIKPGTSTSSFNTPGMTTNCKNLETTEETLNCEKLLKESPQPLLTVTPDCSNLETTEEQFNCEKLLKESPQPLLTVTPDCSNLETTEEQFNCEKLLKETVTPEQPDCKVSAEDDPTPFRLGLKELDDDDNDCMKLQMEESTTPDTDDCIDKKRKKDNKIDSEVKTDNGDDYEEGPFRMPSPIPDSQATPDSLAIPDFPAIPDSPAKDLLDKSDMSDYDSDSDLLLKLPENAGEVFMNMDNKRKKSVDEAKDQADLDQLPLSADIDVPYSEQMAGKQKSSMNCSKVPTESDEDMTKPTSMEQRVHENFWLQNEEESVVRETQSRNMRKYMDFTVNPCEDFFQYACGNWYKFNPIPSDRVSFDTFDLLRESLDYILKEILQADFDERVEHYPPDIWQQIHPEYSDVFHKRVLTRRRSPLRKSSAIRKNRVLSAYDRNAVPPYTFDNEDLYNYLSQPVRKYRLVSHYRGINPITAAPLNYPEGISATSKAQFLFHSCMNTEEVERRGIQPALRLLKELGGWPVLDEDWDARTFDFVWLLAQLRLYNNDILMSEWVGPDIRNSKEYVIQIDQTTLGLPNREYYLDPGNPIYLKAYQRYIRSVTTLMGANSETAHQDALDIVAFEVELASITVPTDARRNVSEIYIRITINELHRLVPQFNWMRYFKLVSDDYIGGEHDMVLYCFNYIRKMMHLISSHNVRTTANYMLWRFMRHRVNNLDDRFQEAKQRFYKVVFGRENPPPRWQSCVMQVNSNMGMAVGKLFVNKYFSEQSKRDTLHMTNYLRASFADILQDTTWLDPITTDLALIKLQAMRLKIGYPNYILDAHKLDYRYRDVEIHPHYYFENSLSILQHLTRLEHYKLKRPVDKNLWNSAPAVVNAYYSRNKNQIIFPAGILQPPFYHRHFPKCLNFGGMGIVMGHEMTHGFDDKGRLFDKEGNLKNWWKDESIEEFHERSQCLIDQYNHYVIPEANVQMDGASTQGENIADNGGLKQAFMAYKLWLQEHPKSVETLPGMNLTNMQLFFLNFAQIWCGDIRAEAAATKLRGALHSPGKFRVIGTISNSEDFSSVFNCPSNSPMNPEDKCTIW